MINSNGFYIFALALCMSAGIWFCCTGEGLAGLWAFTSGIWVLNAWLRDRSVGEWKRKYHELYSKSVKEKGSV